MSGIYIPGMEMSKSCYGCPCKIDDGFYEFICGLTKSGCQWDERPDDCPLIKVPPHGRLIDADDVFHVLTNYYHHSTEFQREALKEALARVSTIIPADPADKKGEG